MTASTRADEVIDYLAGALTRQQHQRERILARPGVKGKDGLELAAFRCLYTLVDSAPKRSGELAEAVHFDPSTVSRYVTQLVDLGLVRREVDPRDGRASVLVATDAGRERTQMLREHRNAKMRAIIADWDDDDIRTLGTLLNRLVDDTETFLVNGCFDSGSDSDPDQTS